MVGLTGKYLIIFLCDVDMQQVAVFVVPGGFKLPMQAEGGTKEARYWVNIPWLGRLVIMVWT